jgi:hypothetical protein
MGRIPKMRSWVLGSVLVLSLAAGVVACKLSKGDHCQIDDDCESGLVCTSLGFCDTTKNSVIDAAPASDARPDGGRPPAPDASQLPDATAVPDASLLPDAQ